MKSLAHGVAFHCFTSSIFWLYVAEWGDMVSMGLDVSNSGNGLLRIQYQVITLFVFFWNMKMYLHIQSFLSAGSWNPYLMAPFY